MGDSVDVDALEQRVAEWYERYAIGPVSTKAGSQLFNDMLTALRQQQSDIAELLHDLTRYMTIANNEVNEITRLRAAMEKADALTTGPTSGSVVARISLILRKALK